MEHPKTRWIRLVLAAVAGGALVLFLASIGDVLEVVVVAALLAYLLDPVVRRLERRGLSRTAATGAVFTLLLLLLTGAVVFLVPAAAALLRAIQQGLDVDHTRTLLSNLERTLAVRVPFLDAGDLNLMETLRRFVIEHVGDAVNYVPSVVSLLGNAVLIPFVMFFLLKDGRTLKKGCVALVPNRYFELSLTVLHKTDVQLGNYLRGQVIDAAVVGLLSIAALWLLDVDYYVLIGALAGVANMVPYVGPVAGGFVAVLVSSLTGGTALDAVAIVLAFVGIQLLDNAVIHPLVVARNVRLHPLVILLAVVLGGKFFGLLGLLLAVPATAIAKVMVTETAVNLRRYRVA